MRVVLAAVVFVLALSGFVWIPAVGRADTVKAPDHTPCVCALLPSERFDVVVATPETRDGQTVLVVRTILSHGDDKRQVVGEPIVGAGYFVGDTEQLDPVLAYDTQNAQFGIFYLVALNTTDLAIAQLRSLLVEGDQRASRCWTSFSLAELKSFLKAVAKGGRDCVVLATEYLGFPNKNGEYEDGACRGGGSPGWPISIMAMLGFMWLRAGRGRSSATNS